MGARRKPYDGNPSLFLTQGRAKGRHAHQEEIQRGFRDSSQEAEELLERTCGGGGSMPPTAQVDSALKQLRD